MKYVDLYLFSLGVYFKFKRAEAILRIRLDQKQRVFEAMSQKAIEFRGQSLNEDYSEVVLAHLKQIPSARSMKAPELRKRLGLCKVIHLLVSGVRATMQSCWPPTRCTMNREPNSSCLGERTKMKLVNVNRMLMETAARSGAVRH